MKDLELVYKQKCLFSKTENRKIKTDLVCGLTPVGEEGIRKGWRSGNIVCSCMKMENETC
jgi:hypothetical protein